MTNPRDKIGDMVGHRVWAVVGASNATHKFGWRIYRDMKAAGYKVYAVNPNETAIDGDPCYASVKDLPEVPDVVDLVVPPPVAFQVIADCVEKGARRVWFQPGAESVQAVDRAEQAGIDVVYDACCMVEKRRWV